MLKTYLVRFILYTVMIFLLGLAVDLIYYHDTMTWQQVWQKSLERPWIYLLSGGVAVALSVVFGKARNYR